MNLVDYSDSDDDTERANHINDGRPAATVAIDTWLKRKRQEQDDDPAQRVAKPAPTLPANFHTLYATQVRTSTSDDPSLHAGRQRQVPHIVGNWPSFVYLEWLPSGQDLFVLDLVIDKASGQLRSSSASDFAAIKLQSALRSELGVHLPLHISLSSPLTLTTNNKDDFKGTLSKAIRASNIATFVVEPTGVKWVSNYEGTRHFLIVTLAKPRDNQLRALLSTCNAVARTFKLPELYASQGSNAVGVHSQAEAHLVDAEVVRPPETEDRFHVSIAWSLVKPNSSTCVLDNDLHEKLTSLTLCFKEVLLKVGNMVSSIDLRESESQR